jgi:hypothetical protein
LNKEEQQMKPLTLDDFPDRFEGPDDPRAGPVTIALFHRRTLFRRRHQYHEFFSVGPSVFPRESADAGYAILFGVASIREEPSPEARPLEKGMLHDLRHLLGTGRDAVLLVDPKVRGAFILRDTWELDSQDRRTASPEEVVRGEAMGADAVIRNFPNEGSFEGWWRMLAGTPWAPYANEAEPKPEERVTPTYERRPNLEEDRQRLAEAHAAYQRGTSMPTLAVRYGVSEADLQAAFDKLDKID